MVHDQLLRATRECQVDSKQIMDLGSRYVDPQGDLRICPLQHLANRHCSDLLRPSKLERIGYVGFFPVGLRRQRLRPIVGPSELVSEHARGVVDAVVFL